MKERRRFYVGSSNVIIFMVLLCTSFCSFCSFTVLMRRVNVKEGVYRSLRESKRAQLSFQTNQLKTAQTYPYWNLSCPLEMSTFSTAHIGGEGFLVTAYRSLAVAVPAVEQVRRHWPLPKAHNNRKRRIFFVGDSLLRQVFIAMTCLLWDEVEDYLIPWFERRPVRARHNNTFFHGPHSKFEEGRIWFKDGTELIYDHDIGQLLKLGKEYESHENSSWIITCLRKRQLSTWIVQKPNKASAAVNEKNVTRERIVLSPEDVVLMNGSVHQDRLVSLGRIAELSRCMQQQPRRKVPLFAYVTTGAEHFPTTSGVYDKTLLSRASFDCTNRSASTVRQTEERNLMGKILPILGLDLVELQRESGRLHVGGNDCLHWSMPGIPDRLAASILRSLENLLQSKVMLS